MQRIVLSMALLGVVAAGCGPSSSRDAGPTGMDGGRDGGMCTMSMENTMAACNDGCDNDGNAFVDCDDRSCCSVRSGCPMGTFCGDRRDGGTSGGRCDAAVTMENTLALCSDGCSNDMDNFADCADFDCCGVRTDCPAGTSCGDRDGGMPRDGGPPAAACDGAMTMENTLAACSDGCSNDGDRFADCEDRNCCAVRTDCGATTYCGTHPPTDAGPVPVCDGGMTMENTLAACSDGCSNDGDTFVDCEDRDCCRVRRDCGGTTYCGRNDAGM